MSRAFGHLTGEVRSIDSGKLKMGTCEVCGKQPVLLVARMKADENQAVCEECHEDPRIPTVAYAGYAAWKG